MGKDYYKTLGIDKSATQEEIKKAFRKLAHQHHPDKAGGDESKFKDINEAYQVLGDAEKRKRYDQFGSAFEHGQANGSGPQGYGGFNGYANGFEFNMDDLGDIFGGLGDMFGFGNGRGRSGGGQTRKGGNIHAVLNLDFMEAVFGAEKEISLHKTVKCGHCQGNGAEPGSRIDTCKTCGGTGQVTQMQRTIFGTMQVQTVCADCRGEGKTYAHKCSKCGGSGISKENASFKVKIPAGINNGESIKLSGQGEAGTRGGPAGDLILEIRVSPDQRFQRQGYDILTKIEIGFTQAALGDKAEIDTVDGKLKLKIPEGTQSGTVFRLKEKGVPRLQGRGRGDQLVEVIVRTPKSLSRKQKDLLKELDL